MELDKVAGQQGDTPGAPSPSGGVPRAGLIRGDRLISIWKAVAFLFVMIEVAPRITSIVVLLPLNAMGGGAAVFVLPLLEGLNFAVLLGACLLIARLEDRPVGAYGLPWKGAFGQNFWLGFLLGLAEISVLIGVISAFRGYSFGALALRGSEIAGWGLFHLALFLCVGLYEEFLFRGYAQLALSEGIGFWPAAILLSLSFGYMHLSNAGENWVGAAGVAIVGLLFAFTLKRTGNLWYAVGLHMSFDWGETFLYSVPNSGEVLRGHLSNALLQGPTWLTGGTVGPEGSVFCFVTMGLQFLVVMWLFPGKKEEAVREMEGLQN
jgi:membrane protease YdiL (CAAX protease family)